MNKATFLRQLRVKLYGIPSEEIKEQISFYSEIIDDKIEEGISEEDAVKELGDINKLAEQISGERTERTKKEKSPHSAGSIILICLGAPIWIALAAAALSVVISLIASLWAVIISLYAADLAFAVAGIGGFLISVITIFNGSVASGFLIMSASLVASGLAYPVFLGVKALTVWVAKLTSWLFIITIRIFRKEKE